LHSRPEFSLIQAMITETFDGKSPAIINPQISDGLPEFDACIVTFSDRIAEAVAEEFGRKKIASFWFATGETPVYQLELDGRKFAFYRTYVGAPACVGTVEDSLSVIRTKKYVVFGGAGCLDREIARGKIMVPTEAYRDEGTSYHYAPASDYIKIRNSKKVAEFMRKNGLPFAEGRTWTTDAFYRETKNNFEARKADGCISVEMECAALQAVCDFRGLELYVFLTGGDLLDAPEWDARMAFRNSGAKGTQHDTGHFDIALELARFVTE